MWLLAVNERTYVVLVIHIGGLADGISGEATVAQPRKVRGFNLVMLLTVEIRFPWLD